MITTNAIPPPEGICSNSASSALRPPAEAPTPTIGNPGIPVGAEDQRKFYDDHQDRYAESKLKVIYLSFAANPGSADAKGKNFRTEAEAVASFSKGAGA